MVIRTWGCLNRNCRNEFTSDGNHPPCTKCGGLRVKWIPGGFAIASKSKGYDATIRQLTDRAGMTNMNDPSAGQRAMPNTPSAVRYEERSFGQFKGKIGVDARGVPLPTCLPNGMTDSVAVKVSPNSQAKFAPSVGVPVKQGDKTVMARVGGPTPKVVARHREK